MRNENNIEAMKNKIGKALLKRFRKFNSSKKDKGSSSLIPPIQGVRNNPKYKFIDLTLDFDEDNNDIDFIKKDVNINDPKIKNPTANTQSKTIQIDRMKLHAFSQNNKYFLF